EHMRQKHRRELTMKAEIVGGQLRASVDAFTADERFENNLVSKLVVSGPEPVQQKACTADADCAHMAFGMCNQDKKTCAPKPIDLQQVAPGRYEATVTVNKYGSFLLRAEHLRTLDDGSQKQVAVSFGHVSNPYPREYASFEP